MRKTGFIVVLLAFLLLAAVSGCTSDAPTETQESSNLTQVFKADDTQPMDASDENLCKDVNTKLLDKIETSVKDESGEIYEMVRDVLRCADIHAEPTGYGWTDKCYVSEVAIPSYIMYSHAIGDAYSLLVFSEDLTEVVKIGVFKSSDGYSWDYGKLSDKEKELFEKHPDEEFIFVNNGGYMAVDASNELHLINKFVGHEYEITGDFYHALDYEALAVSYGEIAEKEHLHEIRIDK